MLKIIKRNDTMDTINYQLLNDDGSVVNLTGASVNFVMGKKNKLITNSAAVVTAANDGIVEYQLTITDTLVSGTFLAEFIVTFPTGLQKTFPSNGYITVSVEQNLDTTQQNVIIDMIAAKQGDFEAKLDAILQAGNINVTAMNEYTWIATEGQLVYTFPENANYTTSSKWFQVYVGNIPVDNSLVNRLNDTQFSLVIDSSYIEAGMSVLARWTESVVPITGGHHSTHEIGGQDPINITQLVGYQENVVTPLAESTTEVFAYKNIGEEQNKTQQKYTYPTRINFGTLDDAPLAKAKAGKGIDLIAHWYNDFGLEYVASASGSTNGWYGWYDWQWNHEDNVNYDSSRHPILGFYKGDDPKVLDWQSYWLAESGINAVIPAQAISTTNWSTPSDRHHWLYQLFNNAKNFKSLNYIPWIKHDGTLADCNSQHDDVVTNVVGVYKNVYIYVKNGKRYATVFTWDQESMRGVYDNYNGSTNLKAEYKRLATSLKTQGYDGICIMARMYDTLFSEAELTDLETNGVIVFKSDYSSSYGAHSSYSNLYSNYANNVAFPTDTRTVLTVQTASKTQAPHPSGFNLAGSTPDLFRKVLQKAIDHVASNKLPKLITVNNVAEWAENGAGLQPDIQNGFGYLDAVKSVRVVNTTQNVDPTVLKNEARVQTLTNTKEFKVLKVNAYTLQTGRNTIDFGFQSDYTSADSANDYGFLVSVNMLSAGFTTDPQVRYYPRVDFANGRLYAEVYNLSGATIANCGITFLIKKLVP